MNVSLEDKRAEAIHRMKMLGYHKRAVKAFEKDGTVMVSRAGRLEKLTPELKEAIAQLEKKFDLLVYLAIDHYYSGYHMTSLLYVSDLEEDDEGWDPDHEDIRAGHAVTYTINHDMPEWSEFGGIGVFMDHGIPYRRY